MKVQVYKKRNPHPANERSRAIYWSRSLPFLFNPRGFLIHRVKVVFTLVQTFDGQIEYRDCVTYWCNNGCSNAKLFYQDPPSEYLLCEVCEANAVHRGELPADQLAGRHVHVGHLRAIRSCCSDEKN